MLPKVVRDELLKPSPIDRAMNGTSVFEAGMVEKPDLIGEFASSLIQNRMINDEMTDELMIECLETFSQQRLQEMAGRFGELKIKEKSWMTDHLYQAEVYFKRESGSTIFARGMGNTEPEAIIMCIIEATIIQDAGHPNK